jgi:hypothetical protein
MDRMRADNGKPIDAGRQDAGSSRRESYWRALDAALDILETVDTLPKSNRPVRLAKVIGIVLDAIYGDAGATNAGAEAKHDDEAIPWYFVCEQCNGKFFHAERKCECPRCGRRLTSSERIQPPWLSKKGGAP